MLVRSNARPVPRRTTVVRPIGLDRRQSDGDAHHVEPAGFLPMATARRAMISIPPVARKAGLSDGIAKLQPWKKSEKRTL